MSCKSILLPLLLERAGVRRVKSSVYIPLIPTFSATAPALLYLLTYIHVGIPLEKE
jgi:hypothetical protein